jgi:hypothetical protein
VLVEIEVMGVSGPGLGGLKDYLEASGALVSFGSTEVIRGRLSGGGKNYGSTKFI